MKAWFDEGRIKRGGEVILPKTKLYEGDKISVYFPEPRLLKLDARRLPLRVLYDDDFLLVVYKPRGISMHPGASRRDETTMAHALLALSNDLSERGGEFRPGIVHRLDKDTEGIVVVAKNDRVHDSLSKQFADRTISRRYWALVWGKFPRDMTIEAPIGRHPRDRKKMAVVSRGKAAKTTVKLLKAFREGFSWIECKLHSGRTHQIRVHLSHKGFPLLGDPVYGRTHKFKDFPRLQNVLDRLKGQALCAFELGFVHPETKENLHFEVEQPAWLEAFVSGGSGF